MVAVSVDLVASALAAEAANGVDNPGLRLVGERVALPGEEQTAYPVVVAADAAGRVRRRPVASATASNI